MSLKRADYRAALRLATQATLPVAVAVLGTILSDWLNMRDVEFWPLFVPAVAFMVTYGVAREAMRHAYKVRPEWLYIVTCLDGDGRVCEQAVYGDGALASDALAEARARFGGERACLTSRRIDDSKAIFGRSYLADKVASARGAGR